LQRSRVIPKDYQLVPVVALGLAPVAQAIWERHTRQSCPRQREFMERMSWFWSPLMETGSTKAEENAKKRFRTV
jgi:hypothetical protein